MIAWIGLIGAVALLIILALRGIDILLASLICSVVVIVSNDLSLAEGLGSYYPFGPLGAFTFAGKFFLLFACGAMFGRVMGESNAAASIAMALVRVFGAHRILWIVTLACALLTYGGVVVFVVIFAIYPLGLKLLLEANIPKRLFCGAVALGAGTFTLTALPGTPSIHNVISSVALGTDLYAGGWLGVIGGLIMFIAGMWYLECERVKAKYQGEGFVPAPSDLLSGPEEAGQQHPSWILSLIPMITVLSTILAPRLITTYLGPASTMATETWFQLLLQFASSQPILWPSIALVAGSLVAVFLFQGIRPHALQIMGRGVQSSLMPLLNTGAVIGFGGVVTHTAGFEQFCNLLVGSDLPPLLSMFLSVSMVSGIVGSASGGLQIFMQTLAPSYLAMGIEPNVLHRLATMAAGGLDSLPHSGAIIAMLTITGLTHRDAYRNVGVITVVIPVFATLIVMAISLLPIW